MYVGVVFIKRSSKVFRVIVLMLILLTCICLAGCFQIFRTEPMTDRDIKNSVYKHYDITAENVKLIGRSEMIDSVRYFSMSGSGIEFLCKGKYVEITLTGDSYNSSHRPRIGIYLNGQLIFDEQIAYDEFGYKTYRIDINDYDEGGVIRVIKLSEAMFSSFGIRKVSAFSVKDIKPTKPRELKIEFIGDSITCGYGVDEQNPYGHFSTATENFTKTYAYLTANSLNADYSAVSFSGYGVYSGFTNGGRNYEDVISNVLDKSVILPDKVNYNWDFSLYQPELVVINLGTNDASYCSKSFLHRDEFRKEYVQLLKTLRFRYPDAYLLCILGNVNDSMYSEIENAVSDFKAECTDTRAMSAQIDFAMDKYPAVIDGHPGELSNLSASADLYRIIQQLINSGELL